jgi:hypothetical protein
MLCAVEYYSKLETGLSIRAAAAVAPRLQSILFAIIKATSFQNELLKFS